MTALARRDVVKSLAAGAVLLGSTIAQAQKVDAPAAPALTDKEKEIIAATAECAATGRVCLARCTDHLVAGVNMEKCQKAVMNMLAVVDAMAEVAAFRTAGAADRKAIATACAAFCRACEKECEPHAAHHEECAACMKACRRCAKACDAYAA
jgi:Cys-rich four helix bundle protein (predicted Tat secretion target)